MTPAAGSGGGVAGAAGAGISAVTLDMIRGVRPQLLHTAADSLSRGSTNLDGQHGALLGKVHNPLVSGLDWSWVGQPQAAGRTSKRAGQISGVSKRLEAATVVLNGLANHLTTAKQQVEIVDSTAQSLHMTVHGDGDVAVHDPPHGPDADADDHAKANQLQGLAHAVLKVTAKVDAKAAAALTALQQGDPTTPPDPSIVDEDFWTQPFGKLVVPPFAAGAGGVALWTLGWGIRANTLASDWASIGRHRATRSYHGRHRPSTRPSAGRAKWVKASKWLKAGRVAGPLAFVLAGAGGALDQWNRDAGRTDIDTEERVARAAWRGGSVGVGSAVGGVVGGIVGGALGALCGPAAPVTVPLGEVVFGAAGSAAGAWVGDKFADATVDWAGRVGGQQIHRIEEGANVIADGAEDAWHWWRKHPGIGIA